MVCTCLLLVLSVYKVKRRLMCCFKRCLQIDHLGSLFEVVEICYDVDLYLMDCEGCSSIRECSKRNVF